MQSAKQSVIKEKFGERGRCKIFIFNLGRLKLVPAKKILAKIFILLFLGVFLFNQVAYARYFTQSHILDDFFKDDGPQAVVYGITSIASIFLPAAGVQFLGVSPQAAQTGIIISSAINIGTQIAVAAGADPTAAQITGGVIGGIASGVSGVVNLGTSLTTSQIVGTIALHTAVWSAQPVVTTLLVDKMDPALLNLCGMAAGMATQIVGAKIYNSLSSENLSINPTDLTFSTNLKNANYLNAILQSLPGLALSTGLSYAASAGLGDDAQQPWGASLVDFAGNLGVFLGNYMGGKVSKLSKDNSINSQKSSEEEIPLSPHQQLRHILNKKSNSAVGFGAQFSKFLLSSLGRFAVKTGFGYANEAVSKQLQDNEWALPITFTLHTAEGFASLAASSGMRLLYDKINPEAFGYLRQATFKDIFTDSLGNAVYNILPLYDPKIERGSTPEERFAGNLYHYQRYIKDMLVYSTNMPAQISEQMENALKNMDETYRQLVLAVYLNRAQGMPSTGYNSLNSASQLSSFGAMSLGDAMGGLAYNQVVGKDSPNRIVNGIIAEIRTVSTKENKSSTAKTGKPSSSTESQSPIPEKMTIEITPRYREMSKAEAEELVFRKRYIQDKAPGLLNVLEKTQSLLNEIASLNIRIKFLEKDDMSYSAAQLREDLNQRKKELEELNSRLSLFNGKKELKEDKKEFLKDSSIVNKKILEDEKIRQALVNHPILIEIDTKEILEGSQNQSGPSTSSPNVGVSYDYRPPSSGENNLGVRYDYVAPRYPEATSLDREGK